MVSFFDWRDNAMKSINMSNAINRLLENNRIENSGKNSVTELAANIEYCPYCGKDVLESVNEEDMYCMDCGRDFKIMTHK